MLIMGYERVRNMSIKRMACFFRELNLTEPDEIWQFAEIID